MSDDFDFNEEAGEETPKQEAPQVDLVAIQAQLTELSNAKSQLQGQLDAVTKKNADLAKFLSGETPQAEQKDAFLETFVANPRGTFQNETQQIIQQQLAQERLIQNYEAKYPELLPFKDQIMSQAAQRYQVEAQRGINRPDVEIVDEVVKEFSANIIKAAKATEQRAFAKQYALPYTVGGATPRATSSIDYKNMSDKEFEKYL